MHTCGTFVWDCKLGVTLYILLYEPLLRGADKSLRVDVWSTESDREHTVGSLGTSAAQVSLSGLSNASSSPRYYLGGWVDHNKAPLLIKPWTRGAGRNGSGVKLEHSLEDIKHNSDRFQFNNPLTIAAFRTYSKQKTINSLSTGDWS